jgi:hypothetical protein
MASCFSLILEALHRIGYHGHWGFIGRAASTLTEQMLCLIGSVRQDGTVEGLLGIAHPVMAGLGLGNEAGFYFFPVLYLQGPRSRELGKKEVRKVPCLGAYSMGCFGFLYFTLLEF